MTEDLTVIQNTHDFTRFLTLSLICNTMYTLFHHVNTSYNFLLSYICTCKKKSCFVYELPGSYPIIVITGLTYVQFGGYSCNKPYTLLENNKETCNGWKNVDKMTCIQVRGLVKATHLLSLE